LAQKARTFRKDVLDTTILDAKALTDERMRLGLEQWLLEGVLWGLGDPKSVETWYRSHTEHHMMNLEFMQQAGLAVVE
jgi:hypothetical protein